MDIRMTIGEIRKNAPKGADFYIKADSIKYFMAERGRWFEWYNGTWTIVNVLVMRQHRDDLRRLHPWM